MRRAAYGLSLAAAVFLLAAVPSQAGDHGWHGHRSHGHRSYGHRSYGHRYYGHRSYGHRHHSPRVVVGLGSAFWWGPRPGWYGPPPAYVYPPRVIVREQPVYIEREPASSPSYWYYCESAGAYYPDVPTCPEPWVKVPPRIE